MLYFAYGTNMDPERMRERAPGAVALGAARLSGWRLTFTADAPDDGFGVPHIEPDPEDEVWGVLWETTQADMRSLDEYEGVGLGAYLRDVVTVSHGGNDVDAIVYFAFATGFRKPSSALMQQAIRGAEAHELPTHYIERLKGVL